MSDLIDRQAAIELILSGKVDDDSPEWVGVECPEECNSFLEWAAEEVGKMPPVDEYDVVAEYCRKRCLVIMTADLFEKIKREYGGEHWIR